jgi:hypothetical protein
MRDKEMKGKETRNVEIEYCARCGMDHRTVVFYRFKGKPISSDGEDWQFWGWCPTFLEPLILRVDEDEEPIIRRKGKDATKEGEDHTLCGCSPECKDSKSCLNEVEPLPTD